MSGGRGAPPGDLAEALAARIAALPTQPGVYLFRDANEAVLYVGKAQSLRARVRSYFVKGGDGRYQIHLLVPKIVDVEVVATANVKEALLLENQLIKKHKPRFNVRLRDDKNYLGLRLDPGSRYPRFTETRKFGADGAIYFGPYTSSQSLRKTLSALQRIFPLRTCTDHGFKSYERRGRPCLEHAVGRCAAPCVKKISDEDYAALVHGAVMFMKGRSRDLLSELKSTMKTAAADEDFETAARLRDRIQSIERTVESQAMISTQFVDRDIFAFAREGSELEIQVLHVRKGALLGGNSHHFRDVQLADAVALDSFLAQYYADDRDLPREVLLPTEVEGQEALVALVQERAGRRVDVLIPKRGERKRLIEMAERNAALSLTERTRKERDASEVLAKLREVLRLERIPDRIECYDVSHLGGALTVASRVVFVDGEPDKGGYRKYKLRDTNPGDDYGAMREVLTRRLQKLGSDPAPDLLLLDGGKGQLNIARAVIADLGIDVPIGLASLAKEREAEAPSGARALRHGGTKREKVFLPNVKDPLLLEPNSPTMFLLQRLRDESHRFAIRYQRELRRKTAFRSILDELPGIGPTKRKSLLKTLGSLERIRGADVEVLAAVPKVTRGDAERIHRFFRSLADAPVSGVAGGNEAAGGGAGAQAEVDPGEDTPVKGVAEDTDISGEGVGT